MRGRGGGRLGAGLEFFVPKGLELAPYMLRAIGRQKKR